MNKVMEHCKGMPKRDFLQLIDMYMEGPIIYTEDVMYILNGVGDDYEREEGTKDWHKKSPAFEVGDEVYGCNEKFTGVITHVKKNDDMVYVMWHDGSCGYESNAEYLHKTGKHIDISGLLGQLKGE